MTGMYTPLGGGDVDIAGIVTALRSNGFDGWFVMEQDTILDGEPVDEGPVRDVRASVAYMRDVSPVGPGMTSRDRRARCVADRRARHCRAGTGAGPPTGRRRGA